jgi:hypothetical protein
MIEAVTLNDTWKVRHTLVLILDLFDKKAKKNKLHCMRQTGHFADTVNHH